MRRAGSRSSPQPAWLPSCAWLPCGRAMLLGGGGGGVDGSDSQCVEAVASRALPEGTHLTGF